MGGLTLVFQSLSSTSVFAIRPFAAAFLVSLLGRWGYEMSASQATSIASLPPDTWLISNLALLIFGGLAFLELAAANHEDARPIYNDAAGFFQAGSSLVVNYGLIDGEAVVFLRMFVEQIPQDWMIGGAVMIGGPAIGVMGIQILPMIDHQTLLQSSEIVAHILAIGWGILMAGLAWFIGTMRGMFVEAMENLDPHNALGLRSLAHWTETGWTATATILIVILPFLALGIFLLTIGMLALVRFYFERREKKSFMPCEQCSQLVHMCAPTCIHCHTTRQPQAVGLFGQAKSNRASDPALHRTNLLARKRCPACATLLKERAIQQSCPTCGLLTFADTAAVNTFLREVDKRIPKTLGICFALGLIPLVGIVPGIIYYQLSLVSSLRGYIPQGVGCLTRWGVRIVNALLISFQWVPGFGAFTLPLMAFISYQIHRGVVMNGSQNKLGRTFAPIAATANTSATIALTTPPIVPPSLGYCAACGTANSESYRFCASCGQQLRPE